MNVLFIAPLKDIKAKDGGYGTASESLHYVFSLLKKEKKIIEYDTVNIFDFKNSRFDRNKHYDVAIVITNPNTFLNHGMKETFENLLKNCKRKYLNILWETIPLPKKWSFLWESDLFDGFVAPSYFLLAQLSKVTKKELFYLPYYVSDSIEKINIKEKLKEELFTVLMTGQNTTRKGLDDGIIAYCRMFNSIKNAQLIVKSHTLGDEQSISKKIKYLATHNMSCKNAPVFLLENELTKNQIFELYTSCSVLLFSSRGEGFGLPPAEAMSVGLPVIYTNWSSLPEVCDSMYNIAVPYYLDEAVNMFEYGYEIGSKYAIPSIGETMRALYLTYRMWQDRREKYYTNAQNNIEIIKSRFGLDAIKNYILNILQNKKSDLNNQYFEDTVKQYDLVMGVDKK